jgi:hypothetical protein
MTPAEERRAAPVSDAEVAALVERARLTEDWLRAETPRSDFAYALDADTVRDLAAALERTSAALAAERRRVERVRALPRYDHGTWAFDSSSVVSCDGFKQRERGEWVKARDLEDALSNTQPERN